MSANLVILYPHYFFSGNLIDAGTTDGETGHREYNLVTGSRSSFYRMAVAGGYHLHAVDINNLETSEKIPDYLYIAGLNLSIAKGGLVNVSLKGDTVDTWGTEITACSDTDVALTDLVGRNNEDYILEVSNPQSRRYWRAIIANGTGTSNFQYEFRKIYAGQWFWPGVEPDAPATQRFAIDGTRRNVRNFSLNWKGLTNVKLKEFTDRILIHRRYNPVVLYARSWDGILNEERLIHARIVNFTLERNKHNFNTIKVDFQEVI